MAKPRKKKRTQSTAGVTQSKSSSSSRDGKAPKSMVIRIGAGDVGPSVSQLVKDTRKMMEPGTASRLRERKANRLRDFTTMAGPLGVTHLLLFSRSAQHTNLRIALTPRGPTLNFRVERYALCRDVRKSQRHPRDGQKDYKTAPLLVMNNFLTANDDESKTPKHLESLTTTVFQSLFPAIAPQSTPLSSIRRVLLLDREASSSSTSASTPDSSSDSYTLNLRHYAITTRPTGVSRGIRKLQAAEKVSSNKRHALPDLGGLRDVSDYLLDPAASTSGFTSGSESEAETDAEVEVLATEPTKIMPRRQLQREPKREPDRGAVEKRAVKLVELGPRMRLRLVKVEEGVCEGRTMWHDYVTKSRAEEKELDKKWAERKRVKAERRRIQKENVERKRQEKEKNKAEGKEGVGEDEEEDNEEDYEDFDDDDDDEADYEDVDGEEEEDLWGVEATADGE